MVRIGDEIMDLNKYIDHTNLKNNAIFSDIERLCREAIEYNFASVCVYPYYVSYVSEILKDSNVKVCTVIGFPSGMSTTRVKICEVMDAIANGAREIDMVINVAALKNKDYEYVKQEIKEIKKIVDKNILKVIIETCLLTKDEIIKMTQICNEVGVDFIKTSTGFSERGASVEDIELMNKYKNDKLQIKASGGIRDVHTAMNMIDVGATRIGTSNGVKIVNEKAS